METRKSITLWIITLLIVVLLAKYTLILLHANGNIDIATYVDILEDDSSTLLTLLVSIVSYWFGSHGKDEAVDKAVRTTIRQMKS